MCQFVGCKRVGERGHRFFDVGQRIAKLAVEVTLHAVGRDRLVLRQRAQALVGVHDGYRAVQQIDVHLRATAQSLPLALDLLGCGLEEAERLALGVGVEPRDDAAHRQRFVAIEAEPHRDDGGPQRKHRRAVDGDACHGACHSTRSRTRSRDGRA